MKFYIFANRYSHSNCPVRQGGMRRLIGEETSTGDSSRNTGQKHHNRVQPVCFISGSNNAVLKRPTAILSHVSTFRSILNAAAGPKKKKRKKEKIVKRNTREITKGSAIDDARRVGVYTRQKSVTSLERRRIRPDSVRDAPTTLNFRGSAA